MHVLECFGFLTLVCRIIANCMESLWYSIMMKCTYIGFFKPTQGLRQCDRLSSFLFILVQEVLSRMLYKAFGDGRIGKFSHPRGYPLVSHLIYTVNILVFTNGERQSLKKLLKTLEVYGSWFDQTINKMKSTIYTSNNISPTWNRGFLCLTNFLGGEFPLTYLGVPINPGHITSCMLEAIGREDLT